MMSGPKTKVSEMSVEDIFGALSDRQITALMFHSQMADLFDFLGLEGFRRMHEYQYISETKGHRSLCRYYMSHYNKLLVKGHPQGVEVIPSEWRQYTRFDVTPQVRRQAVERSFHEYWEWETDTRELYSQCSKALMDLGCTTDSHQLLKMTLEVDDELRYLNKISLELKAISFDPVGTIDVQERVCKHYESLS